LIEGRLIRRDLIYNASQTMVVLVVYLVITWIAVRLFNIPDTAYIFVTILAIISHSLVDFARGYLEKIFFRKEERQLRSELHKLTDPDSSQQIDDLIESMLNSICVKIRATYAIVFLFDGERPLPTASYYWNNDKHNLSRSHLASDDLLQVQPNHFPPPLTDASLLVPLYRELEQIGAIIIGHPVNSVEYPQEDQELILESCDIIAETIINLQQQEEIVSQAREKIKSIQVETTPGSDGITAKTIEDLLRNVLDYAYLGSSDFSKLPLVQKQLAEGEVTHIDCGKYVFSILEVVVEKLRPSSDLMRDPPPREWHPYLILHRAYFEDKLNREIMAELYISEGTFNRTRRAALRSVARALEEMQQASK
jgi:GAF domain-containing protein